MTKLIAALLSGLPAIASAQPGPWVHEETGMELSVIMTDTEARFTLHNGGTSDRRVSNGTFRQLHYIEGRDAPLTVPNGAANMGWRNGYRTVFAGDSISTVTHVRRPDPNGCPASHFKASMSFGRDALGRTIGFTTDIQRWPGPDCAVPVPALPLPFLVLGAAVMLLVRRSRRSIG